MGSKARATKRSLKKGTVVFDCNVPISDDLSRGIVFDNEGYRLVHTVLDKKYDRAYIYRPSEDSPLFCHYPFHTAYDEDGKPIPIDNTAFLEAMGVEIGDDNGVTASDVITRLMFPLSVIPFDDFKMLVQLFDEKKYGNAIKFWDYKVSL